jgi:GT2 family glycosyltransferase
VSGENLSISVVVSNLNGERYLPRLLESLTAQRGVTVEIIVVDRESTDSSAEILQRYPAVRVVHEPPGSGLVAGYAVGASEASHPLLFFCNEDLYLDEYCLVELGSRIDVQGRIVAADPWQWTYDGEQWIHGGTRFRRSPWHIYSPFPFRMHEFTVPLPDRSAVPFACAGALMIDAVVYRELGGWDDSFFLDYEDIDLFLRAWQRGWSCVTVPEARVFHAVGSANTQIVGGERVSRRRYISHRSNVVVIPLKYFTPAFVVVGPLNWLATVCANALRLRWRSIGLDLVVLGDVARRLPAVIAFRRRNRAWNRHKPGQRFFRDPHFSLDEVAVR